MAPTTTATHYTPEDFLALPDQGRFELIDGQLVERHMGAKSSYAATNALVLMGHVTPGSQCRVADIFHGL